MPSPLSELTKSLTPCLPTTPAHPNPHTNVSSSVVTPPLQSSSSDTSSSCKTVMISDRVDCDADFLVNHFLHAFVKAEAPTVFLHLAQTFSHYNLVAQKAGGGGVNLQTAAEKKRLFAVDGLELVADALTSPTDDGDDKLLTRILFDAIVASVDLIAKKEDPSFSSTTPSPFAPPRRRHRILLLIDDLSVLCSLGVTRRHVAAFVYSLRQRMASLPVTFAFRLHRDVEEDEEDADEKEAISSLTNFFAHQVDADFRVEGLSTGYCRDVHGAVIFVERVLSAASSSTFDAAAAAGAMEEAEEGTRMTFRKKIEKQFKIGEKGVVDIFAPGLSAAVL